MSAADLARLRTWAHATAPLENGGVLMGYWRADARDVVITSVIGPGPRAKHGVDHFEPDHAFHVREIATAYDASGRIATYLGDWHTHPGGPVEMSALDRKTLAAIAGHPAARNRHPLMCIVGGDGFRDLAMWMHRRRDVLGRQRPPTSLSVVVF